ncbi:MAG: 2'-deoxycytidine 5'-triphosphate deaminase [Planctomycetes bacterium]|nr:2'-deoxycytidine 5'-triphosphate deaminase [Planctomycetota bacterium]
MGGALAAAGIRRLVGEGAILASSPVQDAQIQPASLDLRLAAEAYKMPGSVLPLAGESVRALLESFHARPIDLAQPAYFDRGQVYLVRLEESFALPSHLGAYTNNKSSVGRIDVLTRTLADGHPRYDKLPRGYHGELWLEVIPKSFEIRVRAGVSLNQAIFYDRREILDEPALLERMRREPLLFDREGHPLGEADGVVDQGLMMSIDLDQDLVGWVARRTSEPIVLDESQTSDPSEYFDAIERPRRGHLLLARNRFHILSTFESIRVPNDLAVEMLPYETSAGEFRAHYAGFFDPGFGFGVAGELKGTPAVLELRAYDDDLLLRHRQPICKMAFEALSEVTDRPYGAVPTANHYAHQRGPQLSKFLGPA